jgi:nuclear pore complex protein Nup188
MATLDCVHTVLNLESGIRDSSEILSCLMYLVEEVLPVYHKWRYSHNTDLDKMSLKLLDVLSSCLGLKETPLCHYVVHSLLYSSTGVGLLQNVAMGAVVMEVGAASWYSTRMVAITEVLKSTFLVLETILAQKSDSKLSPLEESFIHQPRGGRQSLFLYLSSFLYPHHDPDLTTRAIRLFGKLCQDVPMSVYASLGEEAPAIRDTLVARLSTQSASNDLILAILNFIAQSTKSQPGMTELFLAIAKKEKKNKEMDLVIERESCLLPIMDLMKSYKEGNVPPSVAMALYNVIGLLWEDRKDTALVVLRSQSGFWSTVVYPLKKDIRVWYNSLESCYQSEMKIRVASLSLGIITSEAYYLAKSFDKDLLSDLSSLKSAERYEHWMKFCGPLPEDTVKTIPKDHFHKQALIDAHHSFIKSWVMYLVVVIKLHPEEVGINRTLVVELIRLTLEALEVYVKTEITASVLQRASLLTFLLTSLLRHAIVSQYSLPSSELMERVCLILHRGWGLEDFSPSIPTTHVHLFTAGLMLTRNAGSAEDPIQPRVLVGLVPFINKALQKVFTAPTQDLQFETLSVLLLSEIVQACPDDELWMDLFGKHSIFLQIITFMDYRMKSTTQSSLLEVCLGFIHTCSTHTAAAKSLVINNISQVLCLSLGHVLSAMDLANSEASPMETGCHGNWWKVWQQSVGVVNGLLMTLKQNFASNASDFVGMHSSFIIKSLSVTIATLNAETLEVTYSVVNLIGCLMKYKESWQFSHPQVFAAILDQSLVLLNTVVSILNNPTVLRYFTESAKANPEPSEQTPKRTQSPEGHSDEVDPELQWRLTQLLNACIVILQLNAPSVATFLIEGVVDQARSVPMVTLSFSAPQAAILEPPSLGTLVCSLDIGRTLLKLKNSKGELTQCKFLLSLLERVVLVLLSQALCYLTHTELDDGEKELLKQELASELETFLSSIARHFSHKGGHSPKMVTPSPHRGRSLDDSGSSKTTSSFSDSPEQGVFRLVAMFVSQHLR